MSKLNKAIEISNNMKCIISNAKLIENSDDEYIENLKKANDRIIESMIEQRSIIVKAKNYISD